MLTFTYSIQCIHNVNYMYNVKTVLSRTSRGSFYRHYSILSRTNLVLFIQGFFEHCMLLNHTITQNKEYAYVSRASYLIIHCVITSGHWWL